MISVTAILRLLRAEKYRLVVERVLSNGRLNDPVARKRLCEGKGMRLAALSLGLQRALELEHRLNPELEALAGELMSLQDRDGCDAGGFCGGDGVATALAIRAIAEALARCGEAEHRLEAALEETLRSGSRWLMERWGDEAQLEEADPVDLSIMLWQLAALPVCPLPQLVERMKRHVSAIEGSEGAGGAGALRRLALALAA